MSICSICEIEFTCEIAEGRSTCWCVHVEAIPYIHELDEDNCLCKDCLTGNHNSVLLNARKNKQCKAKRIVP
jgi:hypothetical protein